MIYYRIQLYDFWNSSSGLSGGAKADELCLRDADGLPYLPAKTAKGLLRDAAETLNRLKDPMVSDEFIRTVFGERPKEKNSEKEENEFSGNAPLETGPKGREIHAPSKGIFFGNATLNRATAKAISALKDEKKEEESNPADFLFEEIASTALQENGMAKESSLRRIQYALPCTLYGTISGVSAEHLITLKRCMQFVKRLGRSRHRGFGRCQFEILNNNQK